MTEGYKEIYKGDAKPGQKEETKKESMKALENAVKHGHGFMLITSKEKEDGNVEIEFKAVDICEDTMANVIKHLVFTFPAETEAGITSLTEDIAKQKDELLEFLGAEGHA
jgi:hypothetical protein